MSGKVLGIIGAVILAVFTVAIDKYWETAFVQGVIQFFLSLPSLAVAPVGVPLWITVLGVLMLVGALWGLGWMILQRRSERFDPHAPMPYLSLFHEVTGPQKRVLSYLACAANSNQRVTTRSLHEAAGLDKLNFDHAIHQLESNDYINTYKNYTAGNQAELTAKGRQYVVENKMPTEHGSWMIYDAT